MSQPVAISDCVNDLELHNFIEESNFSKALNTCESLESGTLAVPIDEDIFLRMQDLKSSEDVNSNRPAWIGLKDFEDIGGRRVTTRFASVFDNSTATFTTGSFGILPWFLDQPDDENVGENCVTMFGVQQLLFDVNCFGLNPEFMCQVACLSPTTSPTKFPSESPSKSSTQNPTKYEPKTSATTGGSEFTVVNLVGSVGSGIVLILLIIVVLLLIKTEQKRQGLFSFNF